MPTRRRKIEVHRLTISALPDNQTYGAFLRRIRHDANSLSDLVMSAGEKSHALEGASLRNNRLRLRFLSFTTGHRPDILDTEDFSLVPNPLDPAQTGVEWTHVLGSQRGNRYLMLVEKVQGGIYPGTIERYLQWMVDEFYEPDEDQDNRQDPVTISLEAEPGEQFIQRMNALTRIMKASVRIVRPNPGWTDLDTELSGEAEASDAHKAEVSMTARRLASLSRTGGIVAAIRTLFADGQLNYASVEGERGNQKDSFSTDKLLKYRFVNFELDDRGQVQDRDAWQKLSDMLDELD
jgi:hypothetical protein